MSEECLTADSVTTSLSHHATIAGIGAEHETSCAAETVLPSWSCTTAAHDVLAAAYRAARLSGHIADEMYVPAVLLSTAFEGSAAHRMFGDLWVDIEELETLADRPAQPEEPGPGTAWSPDLIAHLDAIRTRTDGIGRLVDTADLFSAAAATVPTDTAFGILFRKVVARETALGSAYHSGAVGRYDRTCVAAGPGPRAQRRFDNPVVDEVGSASRVRAASTRARIASSAWVR